MCMFNGPVHVSKTKIHVFPFGEGYQGVVYQMTTEFNVTGDTMAMILPVPTNDPIWMMDLSDVPGYFDTLESLFPVLRGGLTLGISRSTLEVIQVGSYDVSIAPTFDSLALLDGGFHLGDAQEALSRYYSKGFGFVVAKLRPGALAHPLGYMFHSNLDRKLFIPTRHEHGDKKLTLADWDHNIYISTPSQSAAVSFEGSPDVRVPASGPRVQISHVQDHVANMFTRVGFTDYAGSWLKRINILGNHHNADLTVAL